MVVKINEQGSYYFNHKLCHHMYSLMAMRAQELSLLDNRIPYIAIHLFCGTLTSAHAQNIGAGAHNQESNLKSHHVFQSQTKTTFGSSHLPTGIIHIMPKPAAETE